LCPLPLLVCPCCCAPVVANVCCCAPVVANVCCCAPVAAPLLLCVRAGRYLSEEHIFANDGSSDAASAEALAMLESEGRSTASEPSTPRSASKEAFFALVPNAMAFGWLVLVASRVGVGVRCWLVGSVGSEV
jgi:hypothetical protein